ncbi:hypothetical protein [Falsiphaeobacter marinintestinus]|uniref:hypothetical protein n=1 Tax=Falsiphaeobacter marinintestinus TaxID=1492905 RepID=UPI0011B36FD4|nr:hypothetical protein [Phaeobacter marinintestinus]
MLRKLCLALVVASLPGSVLAFIALNRMEVVPMQGGVFEVIGRVGSGAADYWCGAGDYATVQLRAKATQRVYMWSEVGPSQTRSGKTAIQFSLSVPPSGAAESSYSLSMKRIGDNMRVSQAQNYCRSHNLSRF